MVAALILVGGFGTRLRPLTLSKPKPLVEFANKPIVSHQIDALVKVGVNHIILAVSYLPCQLQEYIDSECKRVGIQISTSIEATPLDTAGPIALASQLIANSSGAEFFVLNCDVISTFPLSEMLELHRKRNAEGTILVSKVSEPSRYGVVVYDSQTGQIHDFVEKPKKFISNRINAGIYIFNKSALPRFKVERLSMEKDIFPAMARDKCLYAYELQGFWMDVGMPKDFLTGTRMLLKALELEDTRECSGDADNLSRRNTLVSPVMIAPSCVIGEGCRIGPDVVIGAKVRIGCGVRLRDCTILQGTVIGDNSWIATSIIGWNCIIGRWVRIENNAVLGENVSVGNEVYINGASVLPHKNIHQSVCKPDIIL